MGKFLSFSQRKGLKPLSKQIQMESIDTELRNGLWSALSIAFWDYMIKQPYPSDQTFKMQDGIEALCRSLWIYYFKIPLDTLHPHWIERYKYIRQYFFGCKWDEVYSFIEFIANNFTVSYPYEEANKNFMENCNQILEMEFSAYRFVGGVITEITSKEEIAEIEEALSYDFLKPVNIHLKTAIEKFADKKNPDYRNSIKESISAVEALCKIIADDSKATLGDALNKIKNTGKVKIHPSLEEAFKKLYGYTSDEKGIRHSFFDIPDIKFEDAKFMLVSCSAFINYLIQKADAAGIKLK